MKALLGWAFLLFIGYMIFIDEPTNKGLPPQSGISIPQLSTSTPRKTEFNQPQQLLPSNGAGSSYFSNGGAPLNIKTRNDGYHYLVKIVDWYSHQVVGIYFIRSGYSIDLDLPIGSYEIKYASGNAWYGEQYLFGPDTTYNKAEKRFDFVNTGYQISGYTVELYTQVNGNLNTSGLSPAEW